MEERDGGVHEQGVAGDAVSDDPVGRLEKEAAGDHVNELRAPIE